MELASLFSGGKDSMFALYLMEQAGHDVPYLVSISSAGEDSWIFHVPNQGVVPLMAQSMGKDLVTAVTGGSEEDDMASLRHALEGLEVDGVVTGAVWSDYQWDRVNLVCGDLGLRVLSPLWRKDQDIVMEEFLQSGIDAIIVGCYAEGFDESWLGRRMDRACVEDLRRLRDRYGVSVMGEGGEYESMVLDSPLHSRPVEVTGFERRWGRAGGTLIATSARLARGSAAGIRASSWRW